MKKLIALSLSLMLLSPLALADNIDCEIGNKAYSFTNVLVETKVLSTKSAIYEITLSDGRKLWGPVDSCVLEPRSIDVISNFEVTNLCSEGNC